MLILMTAALVAAQPAPVVPAIADVHAERMAMASDPGHAQKECCPCCKDMAKKHEGHAEHSGHTGQ